jgi:hypothetical protein
LINLTTQDRKLDIVVTIVGIFGFGGFILGLISYLQRRKELKKDTIEKWMQDYRRHSLEVGEVISKTWLSASRFSSCIYNYGRLEEEQAVEPAGKNVGLARLHLINGYPDTWKLYRKAVAECSDICNAIKKIIGSFEDKIIVTIEAAAPGSNLVRRGIGYSARRCEDMHFYVDIHVYEAVFDLVQDKLDGKSLRSLEIVHGTYFIDKIPCPHTSLQLLNGLGFGSDDEINELKNTIDTLINNAEITSLVEQYNQQIKNLHTSELKESYRKEIENIWTSIRDDGGLLEAENVCKNIKECRPRPQ